MSSLIGDFSQKRLRNCGLRQYEVERVFGYEYPHTFAIEGCLHSPSQEFLSRFTKWLHLDEVEFSEILQAAKKFRRQLVLPKQGSLEKYQLCNELGEKIDCLYPGKIVAIRQRLRPDEKSKGKNDGRALLLYQLINQETKM